MTGVTPILLNSMNMADAVSSPDTALKAGPIGFNQLSQAPFQMMLDQAVESLQNISKIEFRTNDLIKAYAEKKASVEDVMLAVNELSLGVSLASTVVTSGVQSFKEIQQMPI